MRFFNTAGPVKPGKHYCIPPLERFDLDEVLALVRGEKYFVRTARSDGAYIDPRFTKVTRRFAALPASVAFDSTGRDSPKPAVSSRSREMRCSSTSARFTLSARRSESVRLYAADPRLSVWPSMRMRMRRRARPRSARAICPSCAWERRLIRVEPESK